MRIAKLTGLAAWALGLVGCSQSGENLLFIHHSCGKQWLNQLIGDELHRVFDLLFGGRPAQNVLDLLHYVVAYATGLGNVGLLGQILGKQCA